jgi:hypothetical protein
LKNSNVRLASLRRYAPLTGFKPGGLLSGKNKDVFGFSEKIMQKLSNLMQWSFPQRVSDYKWTKPMHVENKSSAL